MTVSPVTKVTPISNSILVGEPLEVSVENVRCSPQSMVRVLFSKVEDEETAWRLGCEGSVDISKGHTVLNIGGVANLEPGVYRLDELQFYVSMEHRQDSFLHLITQERHPGEVRFMGLETDSLIDAQKPVKGEFGLCLFEVRQPGSRSRSIQELISYYRGVSEARERDFRMGIGEEPGTPDTQEFTGVAFLRDCYLGHRRRLSQCEVYPFRGLSYNDELHFIQQFFAQSRVGAGRQLDFEAISERLQDAQPVVVVHFPRVITTSPEAAGQLIADEARLIADLLSLQRTSYPELFGVLLHNKMTHEFYLHVITPHYHGEHGDLGYSDDSRFLKRALIEIRTRPELQLYLALYREALMERRGPSLKRHDLFAYFRFWNLLETIARSKNYIGQPLCDWAGNVLKNRKGHARKIGENAKEIVFEHIRRTFTNLGISEITNSDTRTISRITELLPIWYRRRNCLAHGGENGECWCFTNPTIGKPSAGTGTPRESEFIECEQARNEMLMVADQRGIYIDSYLEALSDVAMQVLYAELG